MDKRAIALAGATVCTLVFASSADANILPPNTYQIHNHPEGNQLPPPYGLRLDEIIDVTPGQHDIFSFDFDADGADMRLTFDGTSVRIFGTAFGGLDIGGEYDPAFSGFVNIDFTYNLVQKANGDDDFVSTQPDGSDTGTIELWTGEVVDLESYTGNNDFAFRLGDEDDDMGHRGVDDISGWGWLAYEGGDHVNASDWLFIVGDKIPAPSALALLAVGVGFGRRRRRG